MGLVYRCDECKKVIPAGSDHISILVTESNGVPFYSCGYCTSCANSHMTGVLVAMLNGLVYRVEMRCEKVSR